MSTQHSQALALAQTHYENFPVASALLPMRLRQPIGMIYSFARQADDFADEGNLLPDERLALLDGFRLELDRIHDKTGPETAFFVSLQNTIDQHQLPLQPFYDLLDAFSQDVTKSRYADFGEVMDYCRRSANPIGRLLLHLYGKATPRNIGMSDAICSSLQIINFLQDVAIDYKKDRIYFPQDEMRKYRIEESQIAEGRTDGTWGLFMEFEIKRARNLLQAGAPLGLVLPGRIGLEMRTIIAGGDRILQKLHKSRGDMFNRRPVLKLWDWAYMLFRAVSKR
ncbi:MAG: squalene synthase HpnC [Betaproteobacteria bacterium HGW-Betaproteobacteria-1]|jgi:squalene synthase HpnC|nr:MAG: squalene synthase HpnC [Betaproteobacteria bacterium HGW-Betaproteobacteria-1]